MKTMTQKDKTKEDLSEISKEQASKQASKQE
jgi:hypothetical protein